MKWQILVTAFLIYTAGAEGYLHAAAFTTDCTTPSSRTPLFAQKSYGAHAMAQWFDFLKLNDFRHWSYQMHYAPMIAYHLFLTARYHDVLLVTCANSNKHLRTLYHDGKSYVCTLLSKHSPAHALATYKLLASLSSKQKCAHSEHFIAQHNLTYPVVIKPDFGLGGRGVVIAKNVHELHKKLQQDLGRDLLVQEYAAGDEYGIVYYRYPDEEHGHIFSLFKKEVPQVIGNGTASVQELILAHPYHKYHAKKFFKEHVKSLHQVPKAGAPFFLSELANRAQGGIFVERPDLVTPALLTAVDTMSKKIKGFFYGRYDVKAVSETLLTAGNFRVIELNALPCGTGRWLDEKHTLLSGYQELLAAWELAFKIGERNRRLGVKPLTMQEFMKAYNRFMRDKEEKKRAV